MQKAFQISDKLWWVGALDHDLRVFDVIMQSPKGTSYNSYMVRGEKGWAVFESAKAAFGKEWISRIQSVANPKEIVALICDHTEPDHAGAIEELLAVAPNAKVYSSRSASMNIGQILNAPFNGQVVKQGDTLDLGGITLEFIDAPFLHWPDSIFTYIPETKTLVTGDVFGFHYATDHVLAKLGPVDMEQRKYYFDAIFAPFASYVLAALDKIKDLAIDVICPSHGPVYTEKEEIDEVIRQYRDWATGLVSAQEPDSVFVGYVSAYGYTRALAEQIAEGAKEKGHKVYLMEISENVDAAIQRAESCGAIAIGSPTFNRDALPPVWGFLSGLSALTWRNRPAIAFGSFGWSGEAAPNITQRLTQLGFKAAEPLRVRLKPTQEDLNAAKEAGHSLL